MCTHFRNSTLGQGVFAVRSLEKGARVVEFTGVRRDAASLPGTRHNYACAMWIVRGRVIDPRR